MVQLRDPTHSERELLDTVERGGRTPAGRTAVHLHLSQLLPSNRTPSHLRMAASLFMPLQSLNAVRVFSLSCGDIMVVGKDMPEDEVERVINRIRSLFHDDPLSWYDEDEGIPDPFVTWYAFEVDLQVLLPVVRSILAEAEKRRQAMGMLPPEPEPIGPGDLGGMISGLDSLNIRRNIHRQPCIHITEKQAEILFEEFYVSVSSIGRVIAPHRDILSERWLFQEFSRTLDTRMIAALVRSEVAALPRTISLNLNLESLDSKEYDVLRRSMDPDRHIVVEVQVIDVFTNLDRWLSAKPMLRETGDFLALDGLTPSMGGVMDLERLDPDFVKVIWSPEMAAPEHPTAVSDIRSIVNALGGDRVILSRCDSQVAVTWGIEHGIRSFQGRFIDAVHGAMTMRSCPAAAQCTLKECATRRSAVDMKMRTTCPNIPGLDAIQFFSAPSIRLRRASPPSPTDGGEPSS
ncbi:EAL domain-containing protein [Haematospirillum jordaniae]|uniref:EAL domain-containing protein n=1 Tax=Haematospirillum jordaniae TaxID=1549855 RepID=A0A143DCH1_9PROT|nr:EAL domain-containing protein [Haematospirillum jordaniae]AMW34366.1 hypothetical protein AY555_03245 [Haematospirillum jordaniae]NKD44666.1 EAL domain-containing protein [Haematospirillum jordaniae]NKD57686.1 EAL domain-containing protein [Haematospirillum jordaniae]NKD59256.1 EAL domain-containing protein [Haematospirillum jordaniae]NKD67394.1 EAL domain-containing protein [Haematospirillum jordaniae]